MPYNLCNFESNLQIFCNNSWDKSLAKLSLVSCQIKKNMLTVECRSYHVKTSTYIKTKCQELNNLSPLPTSPKQQGRYYFLFFTFQKNVLKIHYTHAPLWARSFICILNPVDVIAVAILEVVFCVVIAPCAPPADES